MDNKQIIGVLTGYKSISQTQAARLLHKTPQSLNLTIKRDNLTLDDFIKLCDALSLSIDVTDKTNGAKVMTLQATSGKDNTPAAGGHLPPATCFLFPVSLSEDGDKHGPGHATKSEGG